MFFLLSTSNYTTSTHQQANNTLIRHLTASKNRPWNTMTATPQAATTLPVVANTHSRAPQTSEIPLGKPRQRAQQQFTELSIPEFRQSRAPSNKNANPPVIPNGHKTPEFPNAYPRTMLPNARRFRSPPTMPCTMCAQYFPRSGKPGRAILANHSEDHIHGYPVAPNIRPKRLATVPARLPPPTTPPEKQQFSRQKRQTSQRFTFSHKNELSSHKVNANSGLPFQP